MTKAFGAQRANTLLGLIFGFLLFLGIYFLATDTRTSSWNYLFNGLTGLLYFGTGFIALKRRKLLNHSKKDPAQAALFYFGWSAIAWAIASSIWTFYNFSSDIDVPYPSWADVFFILFYPALGLALWNLHKVYK